MPVPTYPEPGTWTHTRIPSRRPRILLVYQGPPDAETNPYVRASSHALLQLSVPNATYMSVPFQGSRVALRAAGRRTSSLTAASGRSQVRARYSLLPSLK